jgi:hypothetical protein
MSSRDPAVHQRRWRLGGGSIVRGSAAVGVRLPMSWT